MNQKLIHDFCYKNFNDIIERAIDTEENATRFFFTDSSYCDIWYSVKLSGRFSIHYERRHIDNTLYRFDNIPHKRWSGVKTFPCHFHDGSEENVTDYLFSELSEECLSYFFENIRRCVLAKQ